MWPSIERLGRICDILGCTSDSLLGTDQTPPRPAKPSVQAPDDDSPAVRRLLRRLRKARPTTVRLVTRMFAALDKHAQPAARGARARAAPGNDDDAAAGGAPDEDANAAAGSVPGDDGGTGEP
jgi:hypothetical protein